jgi:hypothetical protein
MKMRTFWLNLGWLVVLVVTFAVPLTLDAFARLNYFTSLTVWLIPILSTIGRPSPCSPRTAQKDAAGRSSQRSR